MQLDPDLGYRWWFWLVAVVLAGLQGYRGSMIYKHQYVPSVGHKESRFKESAGVAEQLARDEWPPWDRRWGLQAPDVILNFSGTLMGFGALALLARTLGSLRDFSHIEIGGGVYLSVLVFVAVAGTSGALPNILMNRTGFPGSR